jgi:hypothetical protein
MCKQIERLSGGKGYSLSPVTCTSLLSGGKGYSLSPVTRTIMSAICQDTPFCCRL